MLPLKFKVWMGILVSVTLFVPYSLAPGGYGIGGSDIYVNYVLWGIIWAVNIPSPYFGNILAIGPQWWIGSFLFGMPCMIFTVQVYRYITNKTTKNMLRLSVLLWLVFPNIIWIIYVFPLFLQGFVGYVGPLPFQLIIGYYMVRKFAPDPITPFPQETPPEEWWEKTDE